MTVLLDDIKMAALAIDGEVVRTPFLHSRTLSAITGAELFLKLEAFQFTGSFKERGPLNRLLALTVTERAAGVIACLPAIMPRRLRTMRGGSALMPPS